MVDECYASIARETKDALVKAESEKRAADAIATQAVTLDGLSSGGSKKRRCCPT